jgi:hypothetical protein
MRTTLKKMPLIIALLLLAANAAYAAEAITEKNWVNHPSIVEVRSLYQKINESRAAGKLLRKERKFDTSTCEPYEDDARTLYLDRNKKVRIYQYEGGSDDSAVKREMFYDESGKLRFAFIVAGAYNGTRLEHRVYFSREGEKIWESQKLLEGPGYTFPDVWPNNELIQNPVQAFNDKSPCKEEK